MNAKTKKEPIETFEIIGPQTETSVGDAPTGFTWADTLAEPEDAFFEAPVEDGHRERFEKVLRKAASPRGRIPTRRSGAAVKPPKSSD